ncbi:MAG: DUF3343 domain-containing protein [Treponema sp.]|nr:DUF3343 domain-containing protein [Treponema sp.]
MEYIITFKNTNFAIKAEQCLLEKMNVGVLPLPSQISAGCGICLRVKQDEIDAALAALADREISAAGLYSRATENGRYLYEELPIMFSNR